MNFNLDHLSDLIRLEAHLFRNKNIDLLFETNILKEKLISEMNITDYDLIEAYEKAGDFSSTKFKKALVSCFENEYDMLSFEQKQKVHLLQAKHDMHELYEAQPIISLVKLQLVREKDFSYDITSLTNPPSIAAFMRSVMGDPDVEQMYSINFDNALKPINLFMISQGKLNSSHCDPRDIIKNALLSNAGSFALIHNHPSGVVKPSESDIEATSKIMYAANLCGLKLVDHIILGGDQHYSFRENHILEDSLEDIISNAVFRQINM